MVTFDPHPRIALGNEVELIATLERRLELFAAAGAEATLVAAFTPELMALEPEVFAERYLRAIGAEAVAAGADFRFGTKRPGDLELLERLGFEILEVEMVPDVSSSAISRALHEGDVAWAASLLGRPYELDGVVVAGDQRGGTLGYPTANLALDPHSPALGTGSTRAPASSTARQCRSARTRTTAAPSGDRAPPPRFRGRSLRQTTRRRALGAAAGRSLLRL